MFVYKEKVMSKYNTHPLEVVGCEGVFGFIALVLIQISFYFVRIDGFQLGYNPDGRLEDSLGRNKTNYKKNLKIELNFFPFSF